MRLMDKFNFGLCGFVGEIMLRFFQASDFEPLSHLLSVRVVKLGPDLHQVMLHVT